MGVGHLAAGAIVDSVTDIAPLWVWSVVAISSFASAGLVFFSNRWYEPWRQTGQPAEITQWLKAYGQAMMIFVLGVILLVIIIANWTYDERPTIDQAERTTAKEQELKDANQELRTHPVCPIGIMPDLENCDNLDRAVEKCGLYAVRTGGLTHPGRADPRTATWSFRGCLSGWKMSWETCNMGEKNCYLFKYTGKKGFRDMRDFEGI